MLQEEIEDDVTVFDRSSLLGDEASGRKRNQRKGLNTFALCGAFFGVGLSLAIPGPTLNYLKCNVGASLQTISYIFPSRSFGYLVGSIVGGFLFDKFVHRGKTFVSFALILAALTIAAAPWTSSLTMLCVLLSITSIAMGFLDTGGNVILLRIWEKDSGPYMQLLHFAFGLGACISPLVAAPFLSSTGVSCNTILVTSNSSLSNVTVESMHKRQFLRPSTEYSPPLGLSFDDALNVSTLPYYTNHTNISLTSATASTTSASSSALLTTTQTTTTTELPSKPKNTGDYVSEQDKSLNHASGQNLGDQLEKASGNTPPQQPPQQPPEIETNNAQSTSAATQPSRNTDSVVTVTIPAGSVPSISAADNSSISAADNSSLAPADNSSITAADNSSITAADNSSITAADNSSIPAADNSSITAADNSSITAADNSSIAPADNSSITAADNSSIAPADNSYITAADNSSITAADNSSITAADNSSITAADNSSITATGNSSITAVDSSSITAAHNHSNSAADDNSTADTMANSNSADTTSADTTPSGTTYADTTPAATKPVDTTPAHTTVADTTSAHTTIAATTPAHTTIAATTPAHTTIAATEIAPLTHSPSTTVAADSSTKTINKKTGIPNKHMTPVKPSISSSPSPTSATTTTTTTEVVSKPGTNSTGEEDYRSVFEKAGDLLKSISKVQFSYLVIALVLLFFGFVFCFLSDKPDAISKRRKSENDLYEVAEMMMAPPLTNKVKIMAAVFVFFFLYVGTEVSYGQFIATFSIHHNGFTERTGALITAVYWGMFALSRGMSVPLAKYLSPTTMLTISIVISVCSVVGLTLATAVVNNSRALWALSGTLGIGMAAIFPTGVLWLEGYIKVTSKIAAVFVVASSLGEMVIPAVVGYFIEKTGPLTLMYTTLVCVLGCLVTFVVMRCIVSENSVRYRQLGLSDMEAKGNNMKMQEFEFSESDNDDSSSEPILFRQKSRKTNGKIE